MLGMQSTRQKITSVGVRVNTGDQPAKPGDDGQSESSAGDGGTENDSHSVASGNSVRALYCRTWCHYPSLSLPFSCTIHPFRVCVCENAGKWG